MSSDGGTTGPVSRRPHAHPRDGPRPMLRGGYLGSSGRASCVSGFSLAQNAARPFASAEDTTAAAQNAPNLPTPTYVPPPAPPLYLRIYIFIINMIY